MVVSPKENGENGKVVSARSETRVCDRKTRSLVVVRGAWGCIRCLRQYSRGFAQPPLLLLLLLLLLWVSHHGLESAAFPRVMMQGDRVLLMYITRVHQIVALSDVSKLIKASSLLEK